jgi:PAS domain S-box-containing protein
VFDAEKNFLDTNQSGLDLLGYTREELLSMSIPDVDADPRVVLPAHKQLIGGERIINYEHQLKRKDGKIVTVLNNSRPLTDAQGHVVGMQSTLIDITERKLAEERLKASLKEKEILLREIHHRVKNNLTVISSLLSMQANIVKDRDVHSALYESQSRVKAMALIHETLYQSESLALVDLERYVKELISNIVTAFEGITGRISFDIDVRDVKMEVNQAVPCGLIINELVTNALKHAFNSGQNGVVRITAGYTKKGEVELTVSDNGTGFSEELDWKKSKSLGVRLISLMVDQLHGIMDIRNHHGAEIAIKWPVQVT